MSRHGPLAVLVICDGHRADFVRPELCPSICELAAAGRSFARHTAIFPSATRASATSIATGCWPAGHGLHGNVMGLPEAGGMALHDVGDPAFRGRMRAALGRLLRVPTLAERLAAHGGACIASNVSPGAAYFQDPEHFGRVVHRAGSFGPGGQVLGPDAAPVVSHDAAGDAALTRWFCEEVLLGRRPALAVLWLCEPDLSMHADALGSARHLAGIKAADACVAEVARCVAELRRRGEEVLLLVGSDHGQESVLGHVDVAAELVAAGLKDAPDSGEVVVAPQGSSGLVYLADAVLERTPRIAGWLREHPDVAEVCIGDELALLGQRPGDGLAIAFAMARTEAANSLGVPGQVKLCVSDSKPGKPVGRGSHGGLGRYERHPFLLATGGGFAPGTVETGRTRLVDLAPTILRHLGQPRSGMDGLALPQR